MSGEEERTLPAKAVALQYDNAGTPKVTAKGEGELAGKIIETARAHGVHIEEDPVLAEALSMLKLDEEIPPELFEAVAAIIGFILRQRPAS